MKTILKIIAAIILTPILFVLCVATFADPDENVAPKPLRAETESEKASPNVKKEIRESDPLAAEILSDTTKDSYLCYEPLDLGALVNAGVKATTNNDMTEFDLIFDTKRCLTIPAGLNVTVLRTEVEGMRCKVQLSVGEELVEGYMFCVHINRPLLE